MRVDFIITELFVGGAERCLTELAIGMAAAGDQVRVFSIGSFPPPERSQLLERLRSADIAVRSGDASSLLHAPAAYRRLREWFAESPPELCQTFMHHANVLGTLAAQSSGVPICVGGLRVAESRPLRILVERHAVRRMQSFVCVSGAVADFAQRELKCERPRLEVIPNGVDVNRFATARPVDWSSLGWPTDSVVSLFVGRMHPQKGIETLQQDLETFAPANSRRRLLLIGEGPLSPRIDRWIAAVGGDRVKRLPWQADVAPWIKAARLLVLPSRYEGMPNVVLEAMAAARPVVCSRVEGMAELLGETIAQQSFVGGDRESMRAIAESFLSDAAHSESVGNRNRLRAKNEFSLPAMINAYRDLYRRLVETRRREE